MRILSSLVPKPRYGYDIRREVLLQTSGEVNLTFGTLYEQIARLLDQGFIETDHVEESIGGKQRKFYRLTAEGAEAYDAQLREWNRLAQTFKSMGVQS